MAARIALREKTSRIPFPQLCFRGMQYVSEAWLGPEASDIRLGAKQDSFETRVSSSAGFLQLQRPNRSLPSLASPRLFPRTDLHNEPCFATSALHHRPSCVAFSSVSKESSTNDPSAHADSNSTQSSDQSASGGASGEDESSAGDAHKARGQTIRRGVSTMRGGTRSGPIQSIPRTTPPYDASVRRFFQATVLGGTRSREPVTWTSLLLLVLTGAGLLFYFESEKRRKLEALRQPREVVVGKAAIGGPFSLVNGDGQPVTEKDLKGRWTLLYFGFTFCPDICPAELEKIAEAVNLLEARSILVQPVFISVDPERDGPKEVKEYAREFHPRMLGLTGSPEAVKQAAKAFRVYFMKTNEEEDYLVDHSIITYLMDPDFEFVKFFGKNTTAHSLADGIETAMKTSRHPPTRAARALMGKAVMAQRPAPAAAAPAAT